MKEYTYANKKYLGIIEGKVEPSTQYLWLNDGVLKRFSNGGWEALNENNNLFENIKWKNLKDKRDNNQLTPGAFYRITDYITTTTQENTQSAGHLFDVIVLALSKNTLSEEAYTIHSERDTEDYFANSNLAAWKIWYCLDNDDTRFKWADTENGKGVIYRMIDDKMNDCPYDFKNIQFLRGLNDTGQLVLDDPDQREYCYTFSYFDNKGRISDASSLVIDGMCIEVENNTIMPLGNTIENGLFFRNLNNNVFMMNFEQYDEEEWLYMKNNILGNNCGENSFSGNCINTHLETECYSNFLIGPSKVYLGETCYANYLKSTDTKLGSNCGNINIRGGYNITIGSNCGSIDLGIDSNFCTVGNCCNNIRFLYDDNSISEGHEYICIEDNSINVIIESQRRDEYARRIRVLSGDYSGVPIEVSRGNTVEEVYALNSNSKLKGFVWGDLVN